MASFRSLTQNWKLKLLAFALAVLLWVVVSAEQVTSNWIPVPLDVVVAAEDFVLSQRPRGEVEVRFSGPGRELWDLVIRRPPLRVVVSSVSDTSQMVVLDPRMVQIPNELSVNALDVNPRQVTLEFTRVATRNVPVAVRVEDALDPGWALTDSITVQPREVSVTGSASRLAGLQRIATAAVELEPAASAINRVVPLDLSSLDGLQVSPRQVRVTGRVERVVERTLEALPIDVGAGIQVRPLQADVLLRGPQSVVEGVTPEEIRVVVAIDSIPGQIPPEGLPVPVRVQHGYPFLRAEANPRTVRLFPPQLPADSATGPATGDASAPRRSGGA